MERLPQMSRLLALLVALGAFALTAVIVPSPVSAADPPCKSYAPAPTGREQTQALRTWINNARNGTASNPNVLCFRTGRYIVNGQLRIDRRVGLYIRGRGAILDATQHASTTGEDACHRSMWRISQSNSIWLRSMIINGYSSTPGTWVSGCEWQHSFDILGGSRIDIGSTITEVNQGDCLYVASWGADLADHVRFHDSKCLNIGRSGVSIVGGQYVTVERVDIRNAGMTVFNMEPNTAEQGALDVKIRNNRYFGKAVQWLGFGGNGPIRRVAVENNTSDGSWGLYTYSWSNGLRRSDILVRNNHATRDVNHGTGGRLYFSHVDRLTVSGNTIPGYGPCVKANASTSVVVWGNRCP
jgi:hypothetical protein